MQNAQKLRAPRRCTAKHGFDSKFCLVDLCALEMEPFFLWLPARFRKQVGIHSCGSLSPPGGYTLWAPAHFSGIYIARGLKGFSYRHLGRWFYDGLVWVPTPCELGTCSCFHAQAPASRCSNPAGRRSVLSRSPGLADKRNFLLDSLRFL